MVHVKKCPLGKRGKPTMEFHKDGKPQYYCQGWIDCYNDEPLKQCKNCADWADGEQCEKDYEQMKAELKAEVSKWTDIG